MAKKTTTATDNGDSKTLALIEEVRKQKSEISKAERANWATNLSFSYTENSSNAIQINVESNIRNLVLIASFLRDKEESYNEAALTLGVEAPQFTWSGFTAKDWVEDIKMRINKIQIASKRKKLELLESRLNAIITPELRAKLELEAIEKELL